MAGERKYTRIPPESTGDRVYMIHTAEIPYSAKDVSHVWQIGSRYTITGNGGNTFTAHVHGVYEQSSTAGKLAVHYNATAKNENYLAQAGQSIKLDTDGDDVLDTVATVSADAYDVYIPAQNIMGWDNPEYGWNIDRFGSGFMTFAEGPPQITGMGSLRVNDPLLLAAYDFSISSLPNEFTNSREGESQVTNSWDPATRGVKLTTGTGQPERVTHTSHLFHSYEAGSSMLYILSTRVGDTGKENVARAWGAFDAKDGFLFQLKGSDDAPGGRTQMGTPVSVTPGAGSALRITHRFTFGDPAVTGNHEILQNEWNRDTLLGTGGASNPSGMKLAINKINAYWIDFQFLGGGRTRWGVFYNGERIVCHEMYHGNGEEGTMTQNNHPISNPNRPICWAMSNYGTPGSGSEFYAYGASIFTEGRTDPLKSSQQSSLDVQTKTWGEPNLQPYWRTKQTRNGRTGSAGFPNYLKSGTYSSGSSTQYAMTMSPQQFFLSGAENHTVYQPQTFQLNNHRIRDMQGRPAEIRAFYGCIMRGYEFDDAYPGTPTVLYDTEGDHLGHVVEIGRFVTSGNDEFDFSKLSDNFQYGTVRNLADQPLGRALQPMSQFASVSDKYGTGVNRVKVTVGAHPIFPLELLSPRHFFWDKQPVAIRSSLGNVDVSPHFATNTTFTGFRSSPSAGYASFDQVDNPAEWHYMAMVDSNEAWLYNAQADIDDDRLARTLAVDDCDGLDVGQVLAVQTGPAAGANCAIMKVDVTGTAIPATTMTSGIRYQIATVVNTDYKSVGAIINAPGEIFTASASLNTGNGTVIPVSGNPGTVTICGRGLATADAANATVSALDDGLTSGNFITVATQGGNVEIANANITGSGTSTVAKDYWTSLKALQYDVDLGMNAAETVTNGDIALYGNPPPRAAWTFMIKWMENSGEDSDGDSGPEEENSRSNWNIFWRERVQ